MNEESYTDSDEIEEMPDEIEELPDEREDNVMSVLKRMQQQLTFLEKKLDTLLKQSGGERASDGERPARPPFRKKPFDRPFRSFDRPRPQNRDDRYDRGDRGDRDRSGGFDRGDRGGDSDRSGGFDRGDREGRGDRGRDFRDRNESRPQYSGRYDNRKGGGKPKSFGRSFGKKPSFSPKRRDY